MPKEIYKKQLCVDDIRHSEYYDLQSTFDELYAKSANGGIFTNIMDLILSRENILLAYRNMKANKGSCTPGTDNLTIESIGGAYTRGSNTTGALHCLGQLPWLQAKTCTP